MFDNYIRMCFAVAFTYDPPSCRLKNGKHAQHFDSEGAHEYRPPSNERRRASLVK